MSSFTQEATSHSRAPLISFLRVERSQAVLSPTVYVSVCF